MTTILSLLALSFVVFIHELGHLVAALRSGIGVSHFAVGFGPVLAKFPFRGITYSLRALPFGGFVRINGLDTPFEEDQPSDSYYRAPFWGRFLTISAGSLANLVLGFVMFLIIAAMAGKSIPKPVFQEVVPNTPAAEAGLMAQDKIVAVNGVAVTSVKTDIMDVVATSETVELTIERDGTRHQTILSPRLIDGQKTPKIGVLFTVRKEAVSVGYVLKQAAWLTGQSVLDVFRSIKWLITGKAKLKDVSGPIGILQVAAFGLESSLLLFLSLMARISISLGVFNLFPFPMLDGGHNLLLLIEAIRGKRLNKRTEMAIHNAGAAVLILLMIFIAGNDLLSWSDRASFLDNL